MRLILVWPEGARLVVLRDFSYAIIPPSTVVVSGLVHVGNLRRARPAVKLICRPCLQE